MNFLSQKAITIALGISVSLAIASAILFTLNQIVSIYKSVYTTDVSIKGEFEEYAMYDNTIMTGLEMYNTAKRYKNSTTVTVKLGLVNINTTAWIAAADADSSNPNYNENLYDVTYTNTNDFITINFKKR